MNVDFLEPEPSWHQQAACRDTKLDPYSPDTEELNRFIQVYCNDCPVRAECLEASIHPRFEAAGIWGGLRPDARQKIRRREQRIALAERKAAGG